MLEGLLDPVAMATRVEADPVRFPRRYARTEDAELAGLVASCLAYGRAELFGAVLEELFRRLGDAPAQAARSLTPRQARVVFAGLSYRFNVPGDLAALVSAAGRVQAGEGGLGAAFSRDLAKEAGLREALAVFTGRLQAAADPAVAAALGGTRAFAHLLPDPLGGGACKRLMLYLRWMVRGPDAIDLGLWRQVPRSVLVVPLDTHVARIARCLGLTKRTDLGWRTAEEVTASLRRFDPEDPVKYDFALCHHGMSGACPGRRSSRACAACRFAGLR